MPDIQRVLQNALFFTITLASQIAVAVIYPARVVSVTDGDTVTVLDRSNFQHKVRLAGIDAPEKSQAFGQRSKEHLSSLVFGKIVSVDSSKNDKYGRLISKIIVDGQDANLAQVRAGFAWHYKAYEKEQSAADRVSYAHAENDARIRRAGLWLDKSPTPPWDFRHGTGVLAPVDSVRAGTVCPCATDVMCVGPKGGIFCLTAGGSKKYQ